MAVLASGVASARVEAAQQHLHTLAAKPSDYELQFFTPAEHALIDAVVDKIIPADSRSPGASEAKVAAYIDLVAAFSSELVRRDWKSRLAAFETLFKQHGVDAALEQAARNEAHPSSPAEQFFVDVKRLTVAGYYTSKDGLLKELEYKGNQALADFEGCKHGSGAHR